MAITLEMVISISYFLASQPNIDDILDQVLEVLMPNVLLFCHNIHCFLIPHVHSHLSILSLFQMPSGSDT